MAFGAQPDAAIPFFVSKRLRSAKLHHADRDDLKRGALLETAFRGTRLEWWIEYGERWERELPEQADAVTTISRVLEEDTLAWGIDPRKVLFLPSGADVERIQVRPKEEARARARPAARRAGVRLRLGRRRAGGEPAPSGDRARDGGAAGRPLRLRRAARRVPHGTCPQSWTRDLSRRARCSGGSRRRTWRSLPYFDTPFNRARWPIKLGDYMAAGRPVVACDIGELGRVVARARDRAARATPDMSGFAERVLELLRDPRRARASSAPVRAASPRSTTTGACSRSASRRSSIASGAADD